MEYTTLGELVSKAKAEKCGSRTFPVLSMTMHDGIVFQNDRFKKDIASVDRSNYSVVRHNQLVVSFPIDEGVLAVQDIAEAGIVSPAYKIWDINQELVVPKYLEIWLRSPKSIDYYKSKLRGTTARRRSIPEDDFLGMPVAVPPLQIQKYAVELIARTKNIIQQRENELSTFDNLIKARFVEMFGDPASNPKNWDTYLLDDCLERIDNGKSFVCSDKPRTGYNPAVLKLSAATYGDYRPDENKALLDDDLFIEGAEVRSGDLLFTRKNTPELVGMAAYVQTTPPKLMMPDLIFRLVPNERMNAVFLWQLINCRGFRPVIQGISGGSAKSMSNISKERLGKIKVICPPRILQDELIPFIAQVSKSKTAIQKSLDETQLLFDSLMQEYFG